jgi:hypothetical protein
VSAALRSETDYGARFSLEPAKIGILIGVNARGHKTPSEPPMLTNPRAKSNRARTKL